MQGRCGNVWKSTLRSKHQLILVNDKQSLSFHWRSHETIRKGFDSSNERVNGKNGNVSNRQPLPHRFSTIHYACFHNDSKSCLSIVSSSTRRQHQHHEMPTTHTHIHTPHTERERRNDTQTENQPLFSSIYNPYFSALPCIVNRFIMFWFECNSSNNQPCGGSSCRVFCVAIVNGNDDDGDTEQRRWRRRRAQQHEQATITRMNVDDGILAHCASQ